MQKRCLKEVYEKISELVKSKHFKKIIETSAERSLNTLEQIISNIMNDDFDKIRVELKHSNEVNTNKTFEQVKKRRIIKK